MHHHHGHLPTSIAAHPLTTAIANGGAPPPGHLRFNASLWLPCPAGFICLANALILACDDGETWSPTGSTRCLACTDCASSRRAYAVSPCRRDRDTECHLCPVGFVSANGSACRVDSSSATTGRSQYEDAFGFVQLVIVLLELMTLMLCFQWYRSPNDEGRGGRCSSNTLRRGPPSSSEEVLLAVVDEHRRLL